MVLFSIVLVLGMAGVASTVTLTDVTLFTATGTTQAEDYVSHGWGDVNFLSPPTEDPLHGKLPGGRSHIHERKDRRTGTRTHQSDDRTVATTVTPEVFCPDILPLCRSNPLQSLCAVDKGCNVTGSTDIFLTDELFLPPLYLQSIHPHYPGEEMPLAKLNHLRKPAN